MKELWTHWEWDGVNIAMLVLLALAYGYRYGFRNNGKAGIFFVAFLLLVICLLSPLQVLSAHYLFSMHMTVHVILLLLVGPLLLLAIPPRSFSDAGRISDYLVAHPWLAWLTGVGIMWLWHIPAVFNGMMTHGAHSIHLLHYIETISLVAAGMLFAMPVLSASKHIHPLAGVVYLFSACTFCSLLGLLITFAPAGTYHHYLSMHDTYHLNRIIQNKWHISRATDQQAAGLIMWVPCCLIYVSGALYLLRQWFARDQQELHPSISKTTGI